MQPFATTLARIPVSDAATDRGRAQRFIKRVYCVRTLALILGGVTVGTVFYRTGSPAFAWALVVAYVLGWPRMAHAIARRCADPIAAEEWNITLDAAMAGVWMALMQFNLLPCVTLMIPLGMLMISNGGLRLMASGFAVMALTSAFVALMGATGFQPRSDMLEIIASLPALMILPWLTSFMMYRLERRVRSQNRLLVKLGSLDGLSALLNRHYWDHAVVQCLDAHHRTRRQAAMLLIDIDHFKQINDRYGHTVGDEVIARIGKLIRASLRDGDIAGRYGGDEFGVVLIDADARTAELVAERIRAGVDRSTFDNAPGLHCTVSIGIAGSAVIPPEALGDWVKNADAALYRAKASGRNRLACEQAMSAEASSFCTAVHELGK